MAVASIAAKTPAATTSDMVARDAIIGWYKGEFAAANAIIDALCAHIVQITAAPSKYESVFAAIHRRRMNWIPVLNQQIFYPISDVSSELLRAASAVPPISVSGEAAVEEIGRSIDDQRLCGRASEESQEDYSNADYGKSLDADCADEGGSHRTFSDTIQICTDHEECVMRSEKIKISKGFVAKELVKGHMVNVVKGLKLYEDMFTNLELLKLTEYINELRQAGRRRELSGETFIFFNKQMKGNKREIIQLGVPLFQPTSGEAASSIEPIPQILQSVMDHLTQWRLIPESKRPNSCIINFFDEDEHSQPYFKPPHLENPISTLFLSETTIAFGRVLTSTDHNGDYKGSLTLPLLEGSLLVMRGNSADMARHVICPSPNKRVSITFLKVRPAACSIDITTPSSSTSSSSSSSPSGQQSTAITLWQPPLAAAEMADIAYGGAHVHAMVPSWGLSLHSPLLMFGPAISQAEIAGQWRRAGRGGGGGTGVFLPWTVGPKRYPKHLPPRIQKRRLSALSLSQPLEAQPDKLSSLPPIMV